MAYNPELEPYSTQNAMRDAIRIFKRRKLHYLKNGQVKKADTCDRKIKLVEGKMIKK